MKLEPNLISSKVSTCHNETSWRQAKLSDLFV